MAEPVKPRRRYESKRRSLQADQTRRDIVTAAGLLFREHGYGVAMTAIAERAGVAVETIYRIFGSKAQLFAAAVEALLAGGVGRAEVRVEDRPAIRAIIEEPDPRRQVALYAGTQPGIQRRAGPLLRALRDAKAADPELARLWSELEAQRLDGQGRFVARLADRGVLRAGLSAADATDLVWTLCSLAVHDLLVIERGWTEERYGAWLASALTDALLGPGDRGADPAGAARRP